MHTSAVIAAPQGGVPEILRTAVRPLFLLLLLLYPGPVWSAEPGTVLVHALNVRSGPGKEFPSLLSLGKGTRIVIEAREKGWLKIIHDGMTGYVLDDAALVRSVEAQKQDEPELKDLDRKAESIQRELEASEAALAETERNEREAITALNAAEEELDLARRQVREAEAAFTDLRAELERIEQACADHAKEISARENYASQRLIALYKLNWVGRIQLLATAESFFDVINRQAALSRILREDEALLDQLQTEQRTLETLLEQLNARKVEKRALELTLNARIAKLSAEQERRSVLLEKVRGRKSSARLAIMDLQKASRELETTLQHLQSAPQNSTAGAAGTAANPFDTFKGLLNWPVRGKVLTFFGPSRDEKYNVTNFQSGINIQAERGEPIRAVSDGYAVFANWFKGFGNMLIIDHGDHYYTVYAHLEEVFKVKGDRVEKDEVIATVGDSGSLIGPALHFEVRHHDKPMDPLQWMKKG